MVDIIITIVILYVLRNALAVPIAFIMRLFGVSDSTDKARSLVGSTGELIVFILALLGFAAFWRAGFIQLVAGAIWDNVIIQGGKGVFGLIEALIRFILTGNPNPPDK